MAKTIAKTRSVRPNSRDLLPHTLRGLDAYLADYFSVENVMKRNRELIAELKGQDSESETSEAHAEASV